MTEPLRLECADCGALVWDVPTARELPSYRGLVLCPGCGRDYSRRAPILWQLRHFLRQIRYRRRRFGMRRMWEGFNLYEALHGRRRTKEIIRYLESDRRREEEFQKALPTE